MTHEVVVIGGGLAGGAVATALARAGRGVLLLEREGGPHHKVCGEFLSIEAQGYLQALGLDLDALGAVTINHTQLARGRQSAAGPLPFSARSVSRFALDAALLQLAENAGAAVRRGATVTGLTQTNNGWLVRLGTETITAETVMLATGKHDLRGLARPLQTGLEYIGFKMHFRGGILSDQHVQLTLFDGGYAGLERVEGDRLNLCLIVEKRAYAMVGRDWAAFYENLLQSSPVLKAALTGAEPLWPKPLAIAQIPYGFVYRAAAPCGLYRLGDQAAVIPSFCGDGMAIALHSADRAADHYLAHGAAGATAYQAQLANALTPQIARAVRLSRLLRQPLLAQLVIGAARVFPDLPGRAAAATRLAGWREC